MKRICSALILCGLTLGCGSGIAIAHDHGGGWRDHAGNCVQGTETFKARVHLVATDAAPAGSGGVAKIRGQNQEGTVTASLAINLHGLLAGDYTVGISNLIDGSIVAVGQVTVVDCSSFQGGDDDADDNDDQDGDCCGDQQSGGSGDCTFGRAVIQLDPSIDPTAIGSLLVTDTNDTLVLAGDVIQNGACEHHGQVRIKAGPGAPHANGIATADSASANGWSHGQFSFSASNVPANSTFNLFVNGKSFGRVRSGPRGHIILQNVRVSKAQVKAVAVGDMHGRVVAAAHF